MNAPLEAFQVVTAAPTATQTIYLGASSIWYFTSNSANTFALNFSAGIAGSTVPLNTLLAIGQSIGVTVLVKNGATTLYYATGFLIDGNAVTPIWQGGTGAPTAAGAANSVDIYNFTILKTAANTYTVLASTNYFK